MHRLAVQTKINLKLGVNTRRYKFPHDVLERVSYNVGEVANYVRMAKMLLP